MKIIKPYKKDFDYSYTSGAYATIEMIKAKPDIIEAVYIHSSFCKTDRLVALCQSAGVEVRRSDRVFSQINQKENSYVLGVFGKFSCQISPDLHHVALVNPADMGNLGTIIRALVGFGIRDLAIITPAADIWNPKTIRASMGALFHMRFRHFGSMEQYMSGFPTHQIYAFMPDGRQELRPDSIPRDKPCCLVFGNEANGLDPSFHHLGTSVKIPQSPLIDSLNLSVAVAVGAYVFTL